MIKERKQVVYEVGSYNDRRYGKPWIAEIAKWDVGEHPSLVFGSNIDNKTAEILAEPGQILKAGQKDYRKPLYSDNNFYEVTEDYKLKRLTPKVAAEKYRNGNLDSQNDNIDGGGI